MGFWSMTTQPKGGRNGPSTADRVDFDVGSVLERYLDDERGRCGDEIGAKAAPPFAHTAMRCGEH